MTQEERIELLKRVAEVAPKEMGAKLISSQGVKFSRDNGQTTAVLTADDDMFDAEAIIAMLDAMEGVGYFPMLYGNGESYECSNALYADNCIPTQNKTRAEAVARAFVDVFTPQTEQA